MLWAQLITAAFTLPEFTVTYHLTYVMKSSCLTSPVLNILISRLYYRAFNRTWNMNPISRLQSTSAGVEVVTSFLSHLKANKIVLSQPLRELHGA